MTSNLWREASSLILISRATISQKFASDSIKNLAATNKMGQMVDNRGISKNSCTTDYRLLMAKRSNKSSFMPTAYVFPGGQLEISDFSPVWWDIFHRFGVNRDELTKNIRSRVSGPKPPLLEQTLLVEEAIKCGKLSEDYMIPEIALRIAAIRETFEETGVPILKESNGNVAIQSIGAAISKNIHLGAWRSKVQHDGNAFLNLCSELNLCPDIWSLYEWWNWLTPFSLGAKRFDTMFYLCFTDEQPVAVADNSEVMNLKWSEPKELLKYHGRNEIFLAPPQVYELARIDKFNKFDEIREFTKEREQHGVERWLPLKATCSDGALLYLPGDDLYNQESDPIRVTTIPDHPQTLQELRIKSKSVNRIELKGPISNCFCNCEPSCKHVSPTSDPATIYSL